MWFQAPGMVLSHIRETIQSKELETDAIIANHLRTLDSVLNKLTETKNSMKPWLDKYPIEGEVKGVVGENENGRIISAKGNEENRYDKSPVRVG